MGLCDSCSRGDPASDEQLEQALIRKTTDTSSGTEAEKPINVDPKQEKKAIFKEFHKNVAIGNEYMIMYQSEEFPEYDLFNSVYNGQTPLHIAVKNQQYKMIEYLLGQDANPNARHKVSGDTPLITAVRHSDFRAVEILCANKADKSIQNEEDETALRIACDSDTKEHYKIALYLEPDAEKVQLFKTNLKEDHILTDATLRVEDVAHDVLVDVDSNTLGVSNMEWNARLNTERLNEIGDDLFDDIQDDLTTRSIKIQCLESWLERKQHRPPYSWLRRYVVVKDKYLLWSEREMTIQGDVDKKERMRWNKHISLKTVDSVDVVEKDKKKRKFAIKVGDTQHVFRAKDESERDHWIVQLQENVEWVKTSGLFGDTLRQRSVNESSSKPADESISKQ